MRRSLIAVLFILASAVAVAASGSMPRSFAQTGITPQGDEFNSPTFTAPFAAKCGLQATQPCPDAQGPNTYSLNSVSPGMLRIVTQFGSLLGPSASASNNARNLILQPFSPFSPDFTVTTKLTFPAATTNVTALGQTAGIIVYQDDDNFLLVARTFQTVNGTPQAELEFLQEVGGVDYVTPVVENGVVNPTVYLQLTKSGTSNYSAAYSFDNVTFTPLPATVTAAATITPTGTTTATPVATATPAAATQFSATYTAPQIGLVAWGGTNSAVVSSQLPADFDWFRVGNPQTPAPIPATVTGTIVATATGTVVPTATVVPPTATATAAPAATSTPTATPTNTPVPTPTPRPPKPKKVAALSYTSVWYHYIRIGTGEVLQVQAKKRHTQGIWAIVHFATGKQLGFYQNTDSTGFWRKVFVVPPNTISRYTPEAVVTFQLWYGKSTAKDFQTFAVVR